MSWHRGDYLIADFSGPRKVAGFVYRNLGLRMQIGPSPKGRRPASWGLTHQGSGLLICRIDAPESQALLIATEIAECADWSFDGPDGWKNYDPELQSKILALSEKYPKAIRLFSGGGADIPNRDAVARQIAMARAG